ncbi:hypothetical protein FE156_06200 [Streptomyces albidoflavus]|nr:hypothetical protein FE156_06200 [Streptomyces albidoflavus]
MPLDRDAVFSAYLDLMCLRTAVRLAAPHGLRGTALRRVAARVAGQLHEAARRCLGPGQGELDRESFEALFPWGTGGGRLGELPGWASAVLTEGLIIPAGAGYRFAHEELGDWLQGAHLDVDAALSALVHRWRVGGAEGARTGDGAGRGAAGAGAGETVRGAETGSGGAGSVGDGAPVADVGYDAAEVGVGVARVTGARRWRCRVPRCVGVGGWLSGRRPRRGAGGRGAPRRRRLTGRPSYATGRPGGAATGRRKLREVRGTAGRTWSRRARPRRSPC